MFFKQLATKESSLSYFFGCGGLGKGMAVDVVAGDEDWFISEAKMANVTITHVIDTHVHADRYSGGRNLAQAVCAPYFLHESDRLLVTYDFEPLRDGQVLDIGNVQVRCCTPQVTHQTAFACWSPTNAAAKRPGS